MSGRETCPKCGADLPADAPRGICPKCLLQLGLASEREAGSGGDVKPTTRASGFVPPEPEELAKHFPQHEILELLGRGGMGAVYKARQPALERLVAVKILPPEVGTDPDFAERFKREARALAKLSHQNIVSVFDFGQTDGMYYFIMEHVDGANLRHVIETGTIEPEEALVIVPQICEALQFAHDQGIVHRDIKPENILVDRRRRVKIADFGLAKLLGEAPGEFTLTGTDQVMGTVHYMAPERLRAGSVDHRADIYSLGVVFYEMLTGERPIGRFVPPSKKVQVDVRLDDVVLMTLENEPDRRYQQASEIGADVEAISSKSERPLACEHGIPARGRFSRSAIVDACWSPLATLLVTLFHRLASALSPLIRCGQTFADVARHFSTRIVQRLDRARRSLASWDLGQTWNAIRYGTRRVLPTASSGLREAILLPALLFSSPERWRVRVDDIDRRLPADFCLAELAARHWKNPRLILLTVSGFLVAPALLAVTAGILAARNDQQDGLVSEFVQGAGILFVFVVAVASIIGGAVNVRAGLSSAILFGCAMQLPLALTGVGFYKPTIDWFGPWQGWFVAVSLALATSVLGGLHMEPAHNSRREPKDWFSVKLALDAMVSLYKLVLVLGGATLCSVLAMAVSDSMGWQLHPAWIMVANTGGVLGFGVWLRTNSRTRGLAAGLVWAIASGLLLLACLTMGPVYCRCFLIASGGGLLFSVCLIVTRELGERLARKTGAIVVSALLVLLVVSEDPFWPWPLVVLCVPIGLKIPTWFVWVHGLRAPRVRRACLPLLALLLLAPPGVFTAMEKARFGRHVDQMKAFSGLRVYYMIGPGVERETSGYDWLGQLSFDRCFSDVVGLDMRHFGRVDDAARDLRELPNLRWLNMKGTNLSDEGLANLAALPGLESLVIADTAVTDLGLAHLESHAELRELDISGTRVTDVGLSSLRALPDLRCLNLDDTKITDEGLQHLQDLHHLEALSVRRTDVSWKGVAELEKGGQHAIHISYRD